LPCFLTNVAFAIRVGKLKFILGGCRRQPSNWRTDELELLGELTARLYLCIERARAEALLQQSNQRFELTMQAINGFVYEWHLATNHIYRSEGLFKLIGIHAADALPTKEWWMEQIHPEDRERLGEIFAPLPPDCDRLQHEYRVLHADGRWIDVWDRSLLERNSAGEIISMIGSTSDISDRKQRERDNTFLIEIQNDIGFATDIHQMLDVVTEKITAWFGLSMIAIANVDVTANTCTTFYSRSNDGRFPQVAEYNLSDFFNEDRLHQLRLGETVKINDTCDDPQLHANFESVGVCSSLNLPYVSDGVWKFITGVTRSETSIWREDEIRLLNELIPRIYLEIERVHAEATLQHSNQRFELAMQAIDGVLYEWHLTTNHIYRSEGLFRLIGIHPADALPTKEWWMDRINPEDREHLREIFTALPPDCNRLQQEYRVLHADGRWIDVWDRSLLERNSAGEIISIIGSTSNVSDRKRTEQKLRESEERLRLTIEGTQVGTWDQDIQNNNRLFWSDRMFQLFGYEPHPTGEASEETWGKCLHPDDAEWVVRQWQQSLERGVRIRIEFRIIRANDRATRWVEAIGSFKCDSEGRAIRTTGVIFDISDRKFTETALVQSEERYRNLVELIPQLVWIATPEGSLLDVNQRWLDFTGLTLARAKSEGWETIIHAEDIPMLTKHWELAQEEGKYQAKSRMLNADGQYVWHLHQAIPIKDDRGEIIKWFGTATDIDEIAKLEAQSADLLSQIQERNQELDSFSYIVSHDLKAPLRAISNLSQWIEEDISDLIPSENQEQLQLMRSRVFRMEALIDGLLNYARVAREDISTEPVSIAELLAEILDSLDPPASFTVEIVPPLPTFTTKRILLIQVLANLIGNGIKHHGRTDGTINISVVEEAEFYRFNITDNGKGIDPQQQSRIFDIFQTQSSDKQSTGIGLALVKKIVETEGGEIQLTSEVGKGSTFSFTWRR